MIVEIPFPNPALNPNQSTGRHWGTLSGLRKRAHWEAFVVARAAVQASRWQPVKHEIALTITFIQPDRRRRDRDNLLAAIKYSLDGVAEALGVDDYQFEPVTIRRQYGKQPGGVRIEIFNPVSVPQSRGK